MTRGQITIFFLIGFVLVVAVLLLVFARSTITERENDKHSPEANQYLTHCAEEELFTFLDELRTGDFGVRKDNPWNDPGTGVAYGLDGTGSITSHTEFTPPLTEPLVNTLGDDSAIYTSNFFGTNLLQPLCDSQGPNRVTQTKNPHCSPYAYASVDNPMHSLQEVLALRIAAAVDTCTAVDDVLGVDFSTYGKATTEVILGNQALMARTTFSETNTVLENTVRVRLLPLYNYANERLVLTTRNPTQSMSQSQESPYYREGFVTIRKALPGSFEYAFSDVSIGFGYGGEPLTITFIVDERSPYNDTDGTLYDLDVFTS